MNNIEILEDMIKDYENKIEHEYGFSDYYIQKIKKEKQAIENLIQENKELRIQISARETVVDKLTKEIEELKKPKYIINFKTNEITTLTNNFISKDKIKAKIEEIDIEIQCCEYADDDTEELQAINEKVKELRLE